MKRWMVAVALGLAAAAGVVTPGAARASSSAWYQVYQSGFTGGFSGVAAVSNSNIWAVGTHSAAGKIIYTPFIRHFNGSSWQAVTIPNGSGSTADWVSASAGNNVWVGGLTNASAATSVVYRWNGARWGKVPLPPATFLGNIVALAPNNDWALASSGTVPFGVFHWNGSKWQYYFSSALNFFPQGISASSASNVWVSGYAWSGSKKVASAYRWNGSAWHAVVMPHPALFTNAAVTAVSPSNVWIGYDATSAVSRDLHWDGQAWHTVTVPSYASASNVVPDGKGGYWFGPQAILTGSTWTSEQVPQFSGVFGGMTRIPGTTSFLMTAGVETGSPATEKPTLFRFDL